MIIDRLHSKWSFQNNAQGNSDNWSRDCETCESAAVLSYLASRKIYISVCYEIFVKMMICKLQNLLVHSIFHSVASEMTLIAPGLDPSHSLVNIAYRPTPQFWSVAYIVFHSHVRVTDTACYRTRVAFETFWTVLHCPGAHKYESTLFLSVYVEQLGPLDRV